MFFGYKFNHKVEGDLLHVTYSGKIKMKEIGEIMKKIYVLIDQHDTKKILINALNSNVKLEIRDILALAKNHPPAFKKAKTAVVEKKEKESQYNLYQTITENHQVNLKFFNTTTEAEHWLLS